MTAFRGRLALFVGHKFPEVLRGSMEPEDIVQITLARAAARLRQFSSNGEDAFYRWLVTIARHEMTSAVRKVKAVRRGGGMAARSPGGLKHDDGSSVEGLLEQLAVFEKTPSLSAVRHETVVLLSQCLDTLEPMQAQVLRHRFMDQLKPGEIAAKIDRSERAVHGLLHRGLKNLRERLGSISRYE